MNRAELVEKAARVGAQARRGVTAKVNKTDLFVGLTVVDALLPQVTAVEELVTLPTGTGLVDQKGNLVQWRGHSVIYLAQGVRVEHPAWWEQDCDHPRLAWPLTVIWSPS